MEERARRFAAVMLAISLSAACGAGLAAWAVGEANAFYMNPVDRYGTPAYARRQPVADTFWQAQDAGRQVVTGSTATSAQPAYRSASGS